MGALEKIWSIIMLVIHVGLLVAALAAAAAPWYSSCLGASCAEAGLVGLRCLGFETMVDGCTFSWVDPPLGLSFAGLATGGAISLIALIIIMVVEVLAIVAHVLRLLGKTIAFLRWTAFVANWSFVADTVLAVLAVLAFPIAFGVDNGPPITTLSMTATSGVGIAVLIIVICVINLVLRFVPPVNAKTRYSNAVI